MDRVSYLPRWFGWLALTGVLFFFLVSAVLQFLRPDYSFMGTPLSFYLLGPYNGWLHAGFYALAAAIVLLAVATYMASSPQARSVTALVLFVSGAIGVLVTALAATDTNAKLTIHGTIHLAAAELAFIATTFGMLLQSWRFRQDLVWRAHFRTSMWLAVLEFIVLCIYALAHIPASGFMEKLTIVLILLWLGQQAFRLSLLRRR
ncbi:MAG: DUF998 domain-containing protein [Gammaproteobacteria bacterium]